MSFAVTKAKTFLVLVWL